MAQNPVVPGFFQKRKMLDVQQVSPGDLSRQGRELLSQGLLDEALGFFLKAGDEEGMQAVADEGRREGDYFSFEAALRGLGREAGGEEWRALAKNALERGRLWFAYRAFEKADDQPGLEQVRRAMAEQHILPPS